MKRHTTLVDLMAAPPFSTASCAALGAWHRLGVYCSRLTNGGRIASSRGWSDEAWMRGVGCRVGEMEQAVQEGLASWDGTDLVVGGYDLENEAKYVAKAVRARNARDELAKKRTPPDPTSPDSTTLDSTLHDIRADIRPDIRTFTGDTSNHRGRAGDRYQDDSIGTRIGMPAEGAKSIPQPSPEQSNQTTMVETRPPGSAPPPNDDGSADEARSVGEGVRKLKEAAARFEAERRETGSTEPGPAATEADDGSDAGTFHALDDGTPSEPPEDFVEVG